MFRTLGGTSWSYGAIARRVAAAASQLTRDGLGEGDRLIAYCEDTIPLAMLYLACAQIGVLPAPISPVFSATYLRDLLRQAGANAIFTTPDQLDTVSAFRLPVYCPADPWERPSRAAHTMHPGPTDHAAPVLFGDELSLDLALERLEMAATAYDLGDSFLIQPTSGSTGAPKLVLRTFVAFSRYAELVGDEVKKGIQGDAFDILAVNALTHAFAGHMMTMAIRLGATLCIPPGLDAATSLEDVRELDPDVLPMTPRVLRSFVRQAHSTDGRGSERSAPGRLFGPRARLLLSAGGKGDVEAFERLRTESVEVCEFYGSSEASIVALTAWGEWRADHAGFPAADVELRFSRDGEVLVRSPGLFIGYLGDTDFTTLVFDEDFFYKTGDIGGLSEDGRLRILGRKRDMFSTPEGTNIFPERLEIRLEALRSIQQAMLVGDGRPYLTAHLVVRGQEGSASAEDGAIPDSQIDVYHRCASEIAKLNEDLEHIEQVLCFTLYNRPFDLSAYEPVNSAKVKRSREAFQKIYGDRIESLYAPSLERNSPHVVPPGERRYPERTARKRVT